MGDDERPIRGGRGRGRDFDDERPIRGGRGFGGRGRGRDYEDDRQQAPPVYNNNNGGSNFQNSERRRNVETFGAAAANAPPVNNNFNMPAPNSRAGPQGVSVSVSNLPFQCNWKLLKDTFAQVAEVVRADVALDEKNQSKGFGTVVFRNEQDAQLAIREFDGVEMGGRPLAVRMGNNRF